jgi:hypothetical protein
MEYVKVFLKYASIIAWTIALDILLSAGLLRLTISHFSRGGVDRENGHALAYINICASS